MTAPSVTDWAPRAQRLADLLATQGDLHHPAWRRVVAAVPRHVFVPAAYRQDDSGAWQPVDVTSASGLDLVYTPATCSVPWAWAEQLRIGGKILVDVKVALEAGNLVLLHRHPDRLEGRFTTRWDSFTAMRHPSGNASASPYPRSEHTRHRTTTVPPHPWWDYCLVWLLAQFQGLPAGVRIGMHLASVEQCQQPAPLDAVQA